MSLYFLLVMRKEFFAACAGDDCASYTGVFIVVWVGRKERVSYTYFSVGGR